MSWAILEISLQYCNCTTVLTFFFHLVAHRLNLPRRRTSVPWWRVYWIASTAARAAGFLSMSACSRESLFNPPCHGWASCLLIFYIKPAILGYTPLLTKGQPCNRCCEWARIQSAGDFVRPSLPGRSVRRARSPPSEWKKIWLTNGL